MVGMDAWPVTSEPLTYAFFPLMMDEAAAASDEMVVSTTLVEPLTPKMVAPDFMFPLTSEASERVLLAAKA